METFQDGGGGRGVSNSVIKRGKYYVFQQTGSREMKGLTKDLSQWGEIKINRVKMIKMWSY